MLGLRLLGGNACRSVRLLMPAQTSSALQGSIAMATQAVVPGETFMEKNKRLKRPLSPHLTIYKPQLTAMLSITHRGTGAAMAAALWGFGIGIVALPHSFPYYLSYLASLQIGSALIFTIKFGMAWIFNYHFLNGIRHLAWDAGYGFNMKTLYKSGWTVVVLSCLLALSLASK